MKVNTTSLSAKWYKWFYGLDDYELPKNLCPYFWKLAFSILVSVPYLIFCTPNLIMRLFIDRGREKFLEKFAISFGIYLIILVTYTMLYSVVFLFNSNLNTDLAITGAIFWLTAILVCLNIYHDHRKEVNYNTKKTPNVIIEFIKAKYNNYCPSLEWENKETVTKLQDEKL